MALIVALGVTVVLSISVTTSVYYTSTNSRSSGRSSYDQRALSLAEAGMNNAVSVLNGANTSALSSSALPSACCTGTQAYDNDNAYWWGTLSGNTWTVYGKGVVKNPGSADVARQVQTSLQVLASPTQAYNAQAWEYVMSTATGSTCDQQLSGGPNGGSQVTITSRLYVFGNLCIGVSGQGIATVTGSPLQVRGKVYINNSQSSIGTSGTPVAGVHIGAGCIYNGGTLHSPCSAADRVWSNPAPDTSVDMTVTAPTADFTNSSTGYYQNASPGPKNACTTSSGTPPPFESGGSTVPDNSVATSFELTPTAADYSCTTSIGEISWNRTTRTLTVLGTIFIDGSAKITNTSGIINYAGPASNGGNGQGTIYLDGTFWLANGAKLCSKVSGSNCDWNGFLPNSELLGIVTHGSGGQDPSGVGAWIENNAQFQGAIYADNKIRLEGACTTQGPMIGSEVQIGYGLSSGTQTNYGFPLINTIPSGFPGVPNTHALPQPPTSFSG